MTLRQDVSYSFPLIRRSPGFAVIVALTLALGIGANASIFSILDALLLRSLSVSHPDRLAEIAAIYRNGSKVPLSYSLFQQLQRNQRVFSDLFAWTGPQRSDFEFGGSNQLVGVRGVSGNYAALAAAQLIRHMLFGVAPRDPLTFAVSVAALLVVGVIAGLVPARRATTIAPGLALKAE